MMPIPTNTVEGMRYLTRDGYVGDFEGVEDRTPYPTIYIPELEMQICKHGGYRSHLTQISLVEMNPGNLSYKEHELAIQAEIDSREKVQIPREIASQICTLVIEIEAKNSRRGEKAIAAEIAIIDAKVVELAKSFLYPPTEEELKVFGHAPKQVERRKL